MSLPVGGGGGSGTGVPPPVTTLPGSPTNGQVAVLVDNLATPTYSWSLQWDAAAGLWLFIGGSPGFSQVATGESTASTTYTALTTAGPSFTVPRAGSYLIAIGCQGATPAATADFPYLMSYDIGGTGAVDADAAQSYVGFQSGITAKSPIPAMRTASKSGLAAATALVAKYRNPTGASGAVTFSNRWMSVYPIAVT